MRTCSLLLRRECCSFSNGEYVKAGLAELEQWCYEATEEVSSHNVFQLWIPCSAMLFVYLVSFYLQFAGSAWDELKHIRQAVGFLVRDWIFRSFSLMSNAWFTDHHPSISLLRSYIKNPKRP